MTFSTLENAIWRSVVGGNSVTCFAALSARSASGHNRCKHFDLVGLHIKIYHQYKIVLFYPWWGYYNFVQCKAADKQGSTNLIFT